MISNNLDGLVFLRTLPTMPTTREYNFVADGKVVGFLQLRQIPSAAKNLPKHFASHIYYEIIPEARGMGYGTELLSLAVKEARALGIRELVVTVDESNITSCRVIEKNNGELFDKAESPEGMVLAYRIPLLLE